jgi:hypothetical protein
LRSQQRHRHGYRKPRGAPPCRALRRCCDPSRSKECKRASSRASRRAMIMAPSVLELIFKFNRSSREFAFRFFGGGNEHAFDSLFALLALIGHRRFPYSPAPSGRRQRLTSAASSWQMPSWRPRESATGTCWLQGNRARRLQFPLRTDRVRVISMQNAEPSIQPISS